MSADIATIFIEKDPQFGPVIRCTDLEEGDAFDDFLVERGFEEVSTRFSERQVEFFIPSSSINELVDLVAEFRAT